MVGVGAELAFLARPVEEAEGDEVGPEAEAARLSLKS